jgi:uncharacterized protein YggE
MPVKKSFARPGMDESMIPVMPSVQKPESPERSIDCCKYEKCERHGWCGWVGKKLLSTFVGILIVYMIVFLGVLIRNEIKEYNHIGKAPTMERTIRLEGEGKVSVKPDVAMTTMGVTTEAPTVAEAQQKNTETVNKLIMRIKESGIDSADIQTQDYNVYPVYNYSTEGEAELRGYTISQNVAIKIRDLSKANQVLALAGEVGATNVSGLQFTIDDKEAYLEEARTEGLKKVAEKAEALSSMLGLNLSAIISYDEYEVSSDPYFYGVKSYSMEMGGNEASAPQIETGTEDVVLRVGVTFELK